MVARFLDWQISLDMAAPETETTNKQTNEQQTTHKTSRVNSKVRRFQLEKGWV